MQAVLLAAGRGSRMAGLTRQRSKAMLPVLGVPIVRRVLESLSAIELEEVIVVSRPADTELRSYCNRQDPFPLPVHQVVQESSLGMADALRCAAPLIKGDFILSACDNLVPAGDVARLADCWFAERQMDALLSLQAVPGSRADKTAVVELDGERVIRIVEKPGRLAAAWIHSSLPLYWFTDRILAYLEGIALSPRGELELQSAIQALISAGGDVRGISVSRRLNLTYPEDLLRINRHYLQAEPEMQSGEPAAMGSGTLLIPPYYIEGDVRIGKGCVIGPQVFIEVGCRIGDRVHLRDAVLLRGAVLQNQVHVRGQVMA